MDRTLSARLFRVGVRVDGCRREPLRIAPRFRASDRRARSLARALRTRTHVVGAGAPARRIGGGLPRPTRTLAELMSAWCRDLWHEGVRDAPAHCTPAHR